MKKPWHVTTVAATVLIALIVSSGVPGGALLQLPGPIQLPGIPLLPPGPTIEIDPLLSQVLSAAGSGQLVEAVVAYDHHPTAIDLAVVRATGVAILPFRVLPMVGVRGTPRQILRLFTVPGLISIYYNRQLQYFLDESVPLIGADRVSTELGYTGSGVTIAVIDSGIDGTHPDLPFGEKVIQNVKVVPDLFGTGPIVIENLANTDTTSGHGTHVASTAAGTGAALAGRYRGVAIGASLVGVGAGEALFILTALQAFDWVLANRGTYGIRVISNSWGTTGAFSPDDPINVASRMANDAGLVVVFSAGNEGPSPNSLNPFCVAPWVICVTAGLKDGQTLADFSSRGIPGDPLYHPTLTAPGVDIAAARATTGIVFHTFFAADLVALGPDAVSYTVASGTSMATPHVAGVVALMMEANPGLGPDAVKRLLEATATPMSAYQRYEVGAGYLNAFEAVRAALSQARTESAPGDRSAHRVSRWPIATASPHIN
jgi:serine protease AprX